MPAFVVAYFENGHAVVCMKAAKAVRVCKHVVFVHRCVDSLVDSLVDMDVGGGTGEYPKFAELARTRSDPMLLGYISQGGVAFLAVSKQDHRWGQMIEVAAALATVVYAPRVTGVNTLGLYSAGGYRLLKRWFKQAGLVVCVDLWCPHLDSYAHIVDFWNHPPTIAVSAETADTPASAKAPETAETDIAETFTNADAEAFVQGKSLIMSVGGVTFVKSPICLLSAIGAPGAFQRAMPVMTFADGVCIDRGILGMICACNKVVFIMGGAGDAKTLATGVVGDEAGRDLGSQLLAVGRSDGLFVAVSGDTAFLFAPAVAEREFGDGFWLATMRLGAYLADVVCAAAVCDVGGPLTPAVYADVFTGLCADGKVRTPLLVRDASAAGFGEVAAAWKGGRARLVPGFDGVAAIIGACDHRSFSEFGISRVLGPEFTVSEPGWPLY